MEVQDLKRMKDLEAENARLKRMYAIYKRTAAFFLQQACAVHVRLVEKNGIVFKFFQKLNHFIAGTANVFYFHLNPITGLKPNLLLPSHDDPFKCTRYYKITRFQRHIPG